MGLYLVVVLFILCLSILQSFVGFRKAGMRRSLDYMICCCTCLFSLGWTLESIPLDIMYIWSSASVLTENLQGNPTLWPITCTVIVSTLKPLRMEEEVSVLA